MKGLLISTVILLILISIVLTKVAPRYSATTSETGTTTQTSGSPFEGIRAANDVKAQLELRDQNGYNELAE